MMMMINLRGQVWVSGVGLRVFKVGDTVIPNLQFIHDGLRFSKRKIARWKIPNIHDDDTRGTAKVKWFMKWILEG